MSTSDDKAWASVPHEATATRGAEGLDKQLWAGGQFNTGGNLPSGLVPTTLANGEHLPRSIQAASVGHSNDAFAHTQSGCLEREHEGI